MNDLWLSSVGRSRVLHITHRLCLNSRDCKERHLTIHFIECDSCARQSQDSGRSRSAMMEPVRRLCPLLLQTLSFPSFAALSLARQSSVATQATLSNDDRIDGESEHGLDGSRLIPRENDRNESERSNPRSSGTSHPKHLFSGLKLGRVSQSRIYYPGQSYETDDLAPRERFKSEMHTPTQKTRRVPMKGKDVDVGLLEMLDFRNARLLSQFVSETGKLLPRRKSGLSAKVHRKMVKRVKTSRIMGIIPFTERLSPTGVRKG